MFLHADIKGADLPPRTLSLTFDDGPGEAAGQESGPRTAAIAEYLHSQGIAATFFVIGRHAEMHRQALAATAGLGHAIGNHTYSHPGLVALAEAGGDLTGEIARTDAVIREVTGHSPVFFR